MIGKSFSNKSLQKPSSKIFTIILIWLQAK
jgi:hypothetical protein